jgi:hypothetical protein
MRQLSLGTALALAAAALVIVPSAGAKFRISLAVEPAQPWAKRPARVIVRTGMTLPRNHGLELHVVGPGSARYDTAVSYYRLRRIGPKAFAARVRFPRGGRWRLIVPNWGDQTVKVQPSPVPLQAIRPSLLARDHPTPEPTLAVAKAV